MKPFLDRDYYHPEMKGSYSIKKVLPALCPEFSYENLAINNGITASVEYELLEYSHGSQKKIISENLREYVKMDTLAMVKILEVIEKSLNQIEKKERRSTKKRVNA